MFRMVLTAGTTEASNFPCNKIKQMVNHAEESTNKRGKTESCNVASVDPSETGSCNVASVEAQQGKREKNQRRTSDPETNLWRLNSAAEAAEALGNEVRVRKLREDFGKKAVDSPGRQFHHMGAET